MVDIEELRKRVVDFRDERDWKKYHKPKDLALSLLIETGEIAELMQWRENDIEEVDRDELKDELADVQIYLLALADIADIDMSEAVRKKLEKNQERYPVDDYRGEFH